MIEGAITSECSFILFHLYQKLLVIDSEERFASDC